MTFSFRRKKAGSARKKVVLESNSVMELTIPSHFRCPVSLDLMKDPVTLSTGITYDRESIEKWIESGNEKCPVTNQILPSFDLIPNHAIRKMIQDWSVENKSYGIDRIPTPKIVLNSYDISDISSKIRAASKRGDAHKCQELVRKINVCAKESERNKVSIIENGVGYVLSASFEAFTCLSMEKHEGLLEEILSTLIWMFPLGSEGQSKLVAPSSLRCMAWLLKSKNLSTKQNAVSVITELLFLDQQRASALLEVDDDVLESLLNLIKEPICPTSTKANSLLAIYYIVSLPKTSEIVTSKIVQLGIISLLLEILVDSEKNLSQKALGVLDSLCSTYAGREKARENALTVPVIVKKILRVSAAATEFCVSILLKLCENGNGNVLIEALEVGGFQKVLVALQSGCREKTKAKATELLKMMNQNRKKVNCFESSVELRYLKKSY
ncbi:RING-type E3 ubiquitin transferase [Heracleum sosnowskyi]|uniref:U-box domain-containing protein n=1 Tax=Heracleum sosnowskyi TaxID=360622 RepID=A0AAD8MTN8_9APIA|nr:RING-type E3 ubiquitin transferase [Heracleum sosnowskyi]